MNPRVEWRGIRRTAEQSVAVAIDVGDRREQQSEQASRRFPPETVVERRAVHTQDRGHDERRSHERGREAYAAAGARRLEGPRLSVSPALHQPDNQHNQDDHCDQQHRKLQQLTARDRQKLRGPAPGEIEHQLEIKRST